MNPMPMKAFCVIHHDALACFRDCAAQQSRFEGSPTAPGRVNGVFTRRCSRRVRGTPLERQHLDLAASLQAVLEASALHLVRWLREASGQRQLAMAGGVALNCVMNARLRDSQVFEAIWVQPAAGDAGTALGAALWVDGRERQAGQGASASSDPAAPVTPAPRRWQMDHAYLGPDYADEAIEGNSG